MPSGGRRKVGVALLRGCELRPLEFSHKAAQELGFNLGQLKSTPGLPLHRPPRKALSNSGRPATLQSNCTDASKYQPLAQTAGAWLHKIDMELAKDTRVGVATRVPIAGKPTQS